MKRHELLILLAVAITLGIVGTVATFGMWTLMPWGGVLLVPTLFFNVKEG